MRIVATIAERWNAFWRGANAIALAMDADPLAEIHGRMQRLEAEVFGPNPAATAPPNARPANSHPKESST